MKEIRIQYGCLESDLSFLFGGQWNDCYYLSTDEINNAIGNRSSDCYSNSAGRMLVTPFSPHLDSDASSRGVCNHFRMS